jgi:hypothetical protein
MQAKYVLLFLLGIQVPGKINAQGDKLVSGLNVQEISVSKWNTPEGLAYKEVPGVNLGVTSFEQINATEMAYLSNAANEINITNIGTGRVIRRFPVLFAPRDFVYDQGFFYVLAERAMNVYDNKGEVVNTFNLPASALGVERICRFGNETFLLLPSGNSLKIESAGKTSDASELSGWITQQGHFVSASMQGNTYTVHVATSGGLSYDKRFSTSGHLAGAYVIGAMANRIYLDIQTFVSESPIQVQRKVVGIELTPLGTLEVVSSLLVPDCYYVLSNNDLHIDAQGKLLQMITAPQGIYIYALSEVPAAKLTGFYPAAISGMKYHFNDHLVSVEQK